MSIIDRGRGAIGVLLGLAVPEQTLAAREDGIIDAALIADEHAARVRKSASAAIRAYEGNPSLGDPRPQIAHRVAAIADTIGAIEGLLSPAGRARLHGLRHKRATDAAQRRAEQPS